MISAIDRPAPVLSNRCSFVLLLDTCISDNESSIKELSNNGY